MKRRRQGAQPLVVEAARPSDDAGVRELLRRRAMSGMIRLTLEREPCAWLAADVEGRRHYTVLAREPATGRVMGMGSRAVRRVWVNGERAKVGYLAQLRLAPEIPAGRHLLAAGYDACNRHRRGDEMAYDLTSVVADNAPARRLLERGLPGLPGYHRLCRLITLTMPTVRRPWIGKRRDLGHPRRSPPGSGEPGPVQRGSDTILPAIMRCLDRGMRRYQFAPAWSADDLRSASRTRGLEAGDFLVVSTGDDRVSGCLAIWDQRSFKQVVVRDYGPPLRRSRLLVNLLLRAAGRPRLPPPGSTLELAYLSHLAIDDDRADIAVELIRGARHEAGRRGLDYLVLSLAEANPLLPAVRRHFPARELESILYLVHPDGALAHQSAADPSTVPDDRCPYVEAATL